MARINGEEVKPLVSVSCEAETKKKRACPNKAHSMANGKWLCHVHHPEMLFRKQVAARREDYAAGRIQSRKDRRNARVTERNVTSVTSRRDAVTHGGRGKPPNIVIIPRSEDGHDAGPKDGARYFGIDKPFNLHPSVGKAEDRPRERL